MRRIQLRNRDVIAPFIGFMTLNVGLLLGLTFVAPLQWTRVVVEDNVDEFGRPVESYGTCGLTVSHDNNAYYFLIPIGLINFVGVLFAAYQTYKARNVSTEFSETVYLSISMISLMETALLGGPILLVVKDNPTANFFVLATLVSIACLSILLPMFVPKYLRRNTTSRGLRPVSVLASSRNATAALTSPSSGRISQLEQGRMAIVARH